jgi:hypothetical protein
MVSGKALVNNFYSNSNSKGKIGWPEGDSFLGLFKNHKMHSEGIYTL